MSYVNDPKAVETRDKMLALFNAGDDAACDALNKESMKCLLEPAGVILTPVQNVVTFWWPTPEVQLTRSTLSAIFPSIRVLCDIVAEDNCS